MLDRSSLNRTSRIFQPGVEAPPYPVRWSAPVAGEPGPLAAVGDRVVLGTDAGDLLSLDPAGRMEWSLPVAERLQGPPVAGPEGRVLLAGASGDVRCVGPDGREAWRVAAGCEHPPAWTPEGGCLVAGQGTVRHYQPDGGERWSWTPAPHPLKPTRVGPVAVGPDGRTYVATCLELREPRWSIVALDARGQEAWSRPTGEIRDLEVLPDGRVVAGGPGGLLAFSPEGRSAWTRSGHCASLTPGPDGTLFVEGWNELDLVGPDGSVRWAFSQHGGQRLTAGAAGFDVAVAPDGTAVLTNLTWDRTRFGGAVTLDPEGRVVDEAREGNLAGAAFGRDGQLRVAGRGAVRSVNPGTLPEPRDSEDIGVGDDWIQVGAVRLDRRG